MLVLKENKVPKVFLKGSEKKRQGMAEHWAGESWDNGQHVHGKRLPSVAVCLHTAAARSKGNNETNMKSSNSMWLLLHYMNLLTKLKIILKKPNIWGFDWARLMHSHFWMHCVNAVENPNRNCWSQLKQDYAHMTDSPSQPSKEQCKSLLIDFYKSIMLERQQTSTSHSRILFDCQDSRARGGRGFWCHSCCAPGNATIAHPGPHSPTWALSGLPLLALSPHCTQIALTNRGQLDKNTPEMFSHHEKALGGKQPRPQPAHAPGGHRSGGPDTAPHKPVRTAGSSCLFTWKNK